ncbi:MAG: hypothetical protein CL867_10145 [Cytophagaceae bacterium]|nr:hypothetical protein [Cytophagaceae bacterium]
MQIRSIHIKLIGLIAITVFLYAFSSKRNARRQVEKVVIAFTDEGSPFMTRKTVNKLLIQSNDSVTGKVKENLALNKMEASVKEHPIVKNADVYVTMSGEVGVTVEQRKPIARLNGETSFYMDETGTKMPLSTNFSAHVPLVNGVSKAQWPEVYRLAGFIQKDAFLKKHITGITRDNNGYYRLDARKLDYKLVLGKVKGLSEKFNNYKAFYQKAAKDKTLDHYKTVNLMFENQVVCEKK